MELVLEKAIEYTRDWIERYGESFIQMYRDKPHQKDRLYALFSVAEYPGRPLSRFAVICPLCGYTSKFYKDTISSNNPRLAYFSRIASVLASHLYRKHDWGSLFEKHEGFRGVIQETFIVSSNTYVCKECGYALPNLLLTVIHHMLHHGG